MFASNGKISDRQLFRLYVFDLIGMGTLLLPSYLAKASGIGGMIGILLGGLLGYIYLRYLGKILSKTNMDMELYLEQNAGIWVKKLVYVLLFIHCFMTGGYIAYVFCDLMQYSLVKDISFLLLLLMTIIVTAYSVAGGIENRARIYEVLFWVILIPYSIMMVMGIKDFEPIYITNHLGMSSGEDVLKSSYMVFLFFTPLFFLLFLFGNQSVDADNKEKSGGKVVKNISKALAVTVLILLGSYVILLGNFGKNALKDMKYPVITLMNMVQIEGNFLKRMDALMLAVWFFTLLALLNLHLHFGVTSLKKLVRGTKYWMIPAASGLIFCVAWLIKTFAFGSQWFINYYSYIAAPLFVAGPGLILVIGKRRKKVMRTVLLSLIIMGMSQPLTSCNATELEDKCFPMVIMVDYDEKKEQVIYGATFPVSAKDKSQPGQSEGDGFAECKENFEKALSREVDYNHIKILVLGENIMEKEEVYEDMMWYLFQSEEFPRNTYVCVAEKTKRFLDGIKELSDDPGAYLEAYLETQSKEANSLISLGDLLDEAANKELILYIPYLEIEKKHVSWTKFYKWEE